MTLIGGGGGGRSEFAQGGGGDPSKMPGAFSQALMLVSGKLSKK
jgi:hypothetical protein